MIKRAWNKLTYREPYIEPVIVTDDVESFPWNDQADMVIAGFGGAGVSAAIEAKDLGQDVLVLDRFEGGGATTISGGIYYAGGGTATQKAAGVEDSPQNMFNYLKQEVQGAVSDKTLKTFCDQSVENHDWLIENGVPFEGSFCPFKTSYPTDSYFFYYSGNESFAPYSDSATPAPRGHRGKRKGISGAAIYEPLRDTALKKGVRVQKQTKVVSLVTDKEGSVVGLKSLQMNSGFIPRNTHKLIAITAKLMRYMALYVPQVFPMFAAVAERLEKKHGVATFIRATKGVVLATGGFYANQKMIKDIAPDYLGGSSLGTMSDDGTGIQMAQAVGAQTELMDSVSAWRFINPPMEFVKGVMVGPSGKRVCNEMLYGAQLGNAMMKEHGGKAYLIMDKKQYSQAHRDLSLKKAPWFHGVMGIFFLKIGIKKHASIKGLAKKLGIDPHQLEETISEYNRIAQSDEPDPLGKPKAYLPGIGDGPYYAVNVSYKYMPVPCASLTLGGLKVNEQSSMVINENGEDIKGLYAIGRTAVGIPSKGYVSGLSIADCVFSGRRAARDIAAK
ncbi:MAG: FAD-binding protein [Pseudomonadales bacterium]|nr:FAD-binding protein [Pseudomonadales bacterium]